MAGRLDSTDEPLDVFVPLAEAARTYGTTVTALRARARSGAVRAYKVDGPRGREWRVSLRSLEAGGHALRSTSPSREARAEELEAELEALRRRIADERRRADRADQELGHALLEAGRLRAALARAAGPGDASEGDDAGERSEPVLVPAGLLSARSVTGPEVPAPRS